MARIWGTRFLVTVVLGLLSAPAIADNIPSVDAFSDVLLVRTAGNTLTSDTITEPATDTDVENPKPSKIETLKPAVGITKGLGVALLDPDGSLSDVVFSDAKGRVGLVSDPSIPLAALERDFGFTIPKSNEIQEIGAVITPGVPLDKQAEKFQDLSKLFGAKAGTILVASDPDVPEPTTFVLFVLGTSAMALYLYGRGRRLPRA